MLLPLCRQEPSPPRVLLPGAGLGRLCVEVAAAGFEAQGNEFSYFMLITAAFMLNATACAEQWTIHPWVHLTCNNLSDADQLRGVAVPDVVPCQVVPPGTLSMCAGDFAVRHNKAVRLGMCHSQPASQPAPGCLWQQPAQLVSFKACIYGCATLRCSDCCSHAPDWPTARVTALGGAWQGF